MLESKKAQIFDKTPFSFNVKSLSEHWEENMNDFSAEK